MALLGTEDLQQLNARLGEAALNNHLGSIVSATSLDQFVILKANTAAHSSRQAIVVRLVGKSLPRCLAAKLSSLDVKVDHAMPFRP